MRNYFSSTLKGVNVWKPMLIVWLVVVADVAFNIFLSPLFKSQPPLLLRQIDVHLLYTLLIEMGLVMLFGLIMVVVIYQLTKATVESVSLKDKPFETEYNLRQFVVKMLRDVALSGVTLGLYTPWLVAHATDYFASNTAHNFNYFNFRGRGMTFFGIMVLTILVPVVVVVAAYLLLLLPLIVEAQNAAHSLATGMLPLYSIVLVVLVLVATGLYYAFACRWFINLDYGNRSVKLANRIWPMVFFVTGQALLTIITLGLYWPAAVLRICRYFVSRIVVGDKLQEEHLDITLRMWRDWGWLWGQILLTTITLGIYLPWFYARFTRRFVNRTYVATNEHPSLPMPEYVR